VYAGSLTAPSLTWQGLLALNMSKRRYDTEILGLAGTLRAAFGGNAFLLPRAYGRRAVAHHVPPLPSFDVTVNEVSGEVGVFTTITRVLDYLAKFPSWRRALLGDKNILGILVWTDGFPFLKTGGAVVTVCFVVRGFYKKVVS